MNHARVLPTRPEIGLRGGLTSVFDQRALMTPVAEAAMPAFDYSTVAELFPTRARRSCSLPSTEGSGESRLCGIQRMRMAPGIDHRLGDQAALVV